MSWVDLLLGSSAPVLPAAWALHWGRSVAWALVLACLGATVLRRQPRAARAAVAMALALWALVPGEVSPTFWLALALQSPSLVGCLLCVYWLWRHLSVDSHSALQNSVADRQVALIGACAWSGVVLGYLLLLDTLALLPFQIYAWGFGPLALVCALAVCLLPWVAGMRGPLSWTAPLALLLFAMTRLPSGNLWDALLDPITWAALHLVLLARVRARSATRA